MPTDRPILRLPDPRQVTRTPGSQRSIPQPSGPGRRRQGERLAPSFAELSAAVQRAQGRVELGEGPAGIAPERALVFETAGSIQNFARAASAVGLEVITEFDLDETAEIPDGFTPPAGRTTISRTLYATMPTIRSAEQILALWRSHQADEPPPRGASPWWRMFDQLIALRVWGPNDRLPTTARETLEQRLREADDGAINVELEIWPTADAAARDAWRRETEARVIELEGQIVARSSIAERAFVYEAILARLPVATVRRLLDDPSTPGSLAWIRGVQFILPQTLAEVLPDPGEETEDELPEFSPFDAEAPIRAVLFDGTPVAAHPALDGGVVVEDVHDLVGRSVVNQRYHATSMASLILRGDLRADGTAVPANRLLCVPIVIDTDRGGRSPNNKLFVDVLHVALTRIFIGDSALAPDAFVVNLSIGVPQMRFAGRVSSLARLLDWWAYEHGVLFVISAGNVEDPLVLQDMEPARFLAADTGERRRAVQQAIQAAAYSRCLMAPAEALNGVTVGAISEDRLAPDNKPRGADVVRLDVDGRRFPAVSSALGLGPFRCIKPDLLEAGGAHEVRAVRSGNGTRLTVVHNAPSGLVVASPRLDIQRGLRRSRGTSCAAALTTRAILQSAAALTEEGGSFSGRDLARQDLALLTRVLAVNAADWSNEAHAHYEEVSAQLGLHQTVRAKEEVSRHFGHGYLTPQCMRESPPRGATFVGVGTVRKDQARIFDIPLPPSLSGDRVPRSMRITLAWFSPINLARARYRLASLYAIAADAIDGVDQDRDTGWGLLLKANGPDERMIRRGTVWSRRLIHHRLASPAYEDGRTVPIRVQCQDASGGGLSPDLDIRFAITVTLEVEADVQYDILAEARAKIEQRVRGVGDVTV